MECDNKECRKEFINFISIDTILPYLMEKHYCKKCRCETDNKIVKD